MRRMMKILTLSCTCLFTVGAGNFTAQAAMNLETDAAVAGAAVAVNNYYASSLNPEEELAKALSSGESLALASAQAGNGTKETDPEAASAAREEVPVVMASSKSAYDNVAISRVSNYVNVRAQATTGSAVVGKIYNNCAATILSTVDGEGGKWYQIQSGTVTGYIKAQYFITGSEAESVARKVGTSFARVSNTSTLRLREQPNLESKTLDLLSSDAEYEVVGEEGDFAKISVDNDLVGYVFKDYIDIRVEFDKAVSVEEEAAKKEETETLKQEANEALKRLEEAKKKEEAVQTTTGQTQTTKAPDTAYSGTVEANPAGGSSREETSKTETTTAASTTKAPETTKSQTAAPTTKSPAGPGGPGSSSGETNEVVSATRSAVVAYAKQFLGNPYVYGGTSLTNGTDCSGFTQGVFAHFGITTGRSSRDQAAKGREIAVSDAQPGDLLFYASSNYINHVALYIGGGQVIHASTARTGITISPSNYRTPCKAVSFLN